MDMDVRVVVTIDLAPAERHDVAAIAELVRAGLARAFTDPPAGVASASVAPATSTATHEAAVASASMPQTRVPAAKKLSAARSGEGASAVLRRPWEEYILQEQPQELTSALITALHTLGRWATGKDLSEALRATEFAVTHQRTIGATLTGYYKRLVARGVVPPFRVEYPDGPTKPQVQKWGPPDVADEV